MKGKILQLISRPKEEAPDLSKKLQEPSENENEFMTKDTVTMRKKDWALGTFT